MEEAIPQYPIDIDCGGKTSQQKEAEVCWKILVINSVCDGLYREETNKIINSDDYDFLRLKGNLRESILESKNQVVTMIIPAINVKLTNQTEKRRDKRHWHNRRKECNGV